MSDTKGLKFQIATKTQSNMTIRQETAAVEQCVGQHAGSVDLLGHMEDFPIGDRLFEVQPNESVRIWFSQNLLNPNFLILGTASTPAEFHAEATEEYGDMVPPISEHRQVTALYLVAT